MKKVFRKWIKNFNNAEGSTDESKNPPSVPSRSVGSIAASCNSSPTDEFVPSKQLKLHFAVLSENEQDVKKYAVKYINNADSLQRTPMHLAVLQGNVNIVNILLESGANLDAVDNEGYTPFLRAVEFGNVELVKVFCSEKLSKTQTDFNGNTVVHLAVLYGFYSIAELLLRNNFSTDIPNKAGDYPIHVATQNESVSTVKLLLEYKANVNAQDAQMKTPLLLSIQMGNISLVDLLLKHNADLELTDADGKGVKDYVASSNNINMKLLFSRFLTINDSEISAINDEDSPTSEQCTLPPVLKSPLSWNVLQRNINPCEISGGTEQTKWPAEFHKKSSKPPKNVLDIELRCIERRNTKYERNAKSLSFDVGNDTYANITNQNRSFSLTSYEVLNRTQGITTNVEDDGISSHEKLKHQLENCQKALQELSLDVINKNPRNSSSPEMKFNSEFLLSDFNHKIPDNNLFKSEDYSSLFLDDKDLDANIFSGDHVNSAFDHQNVTINIKNANSHPKTVKNENEKPTDDDSSDEDPPFWKSSVDGGYFTSQIKRDDTLKTVKSSSGSEDSDSENEVILKEVPNSIVLNRLKQVSQENEDLETETAVLREATEKLKYDLANYRQHSDIKEASIDGITAQLTQLDTKYSKAIEKINVFQLCMNNLEQEIAHLRHVCNKSYKINQQLMKQLQEMHDENKQMKSEKNQIADQNALDVQKLQTDVLYWKSKYEELLQKGEEKNLAAFEMQSLFKLNLELNKISDKIKDCLCKSDLAKLQDQQQVFIGQTVQQILNEADHKLQNSLAEIKEEVKLKVIEMDCGLNSKTEAELQIMDLENTKQRLLLEISKLTSALKGKEEDESKMKEQLEKFTKEKQKFKDEKRKQLIKKSYEDKNATRKGMYLSAVRNYLNKSKLSNSDTSSERFLNENIKIDFEAVDVELHAKEKEHS